jgi:hypothetical protein
MIDVYRIYKQGETGPFLVAEDRNNGEHFAKMVARGMRGSAAPGELYLMTHETEIDMGGFCPTDNRQFVASCPVCKRTEEQIAADAIIAAAQVHP